MLEFVMSRIGSNIVLVIVILSILLFVFGLLQFLIKYLIKRPPFSPIPLSRSFREGSDASESNLQQLFRQHDSGLDQALVDALPVFYYKEIVGLVGDPFDCAVCLSEFSDADELKLLVNCAHAFHIHCIETWLMSNSTCPLCRSSLSLSNLGILREDAFPVRLGKFRSASDGDGSGNVEEGSGGGGGLDARRCYSMGAFRYVVGEAKLKVSLCGDGKISVRSRGESLSVSKIWLWSNKAEFRTSTQEYSSVFLPHLQNNGVR